MTATKIGDRVGTGSGRVTEDNVREYRRVILVQTNDKYDHVVTVRLASGVPRYGDPFVYGNDYDYGSLCRRIETNQKSKFLWEVICHYSAKAFDPDDQVDNPLLRPSKWRWVTIRGETIGDEDEEGNAWTNSTGDPLDDPPPLNRNILRLTVRRNEASYDPLLIYDYTDAVNNDTFLGFSKGYAKATIEPSEPQHENGTLFYEMLYTFLFHPKKWDPYKILDAGHRYKNDDDEWVQANDGGIYHDRKVLLDGTGHRLDEDDDAVYLDRHPWKLRPYSILAIV